MANTNTFDWDDGFAATEQGGGFSVLEPGRYKFVVDKLDKSNYPGGKTFPACKMAIVKMSVYDDANGLVACVFDRLYLCNHKAALGRLTGFFQALGYPVKTDGTQAVNWNCAGEWGEANFRKREYNGKWSNEVDTYVQREEPADGYGEQKWNFA